MFSNVQLMRFPVQPFSTALLVIACICTTIPARAAATFTPLGLFGGAGSAAYDVSADGSVVVGFVEDASGSRTGLFRWAASSGAVILPGPFANSPPSVSADGTAVVAQYGSLEPLGSALRWTSGGVEPLGASAANDVSADGRVVVGSVLSNGRLIAYRWSLESGVVALGDVPGLSERQWANGVSADGSLIVGYVDPNDRPDNSFRWTAQTGMLELTPLAGAPGARRVSADGSTIVGTRTLPPPVGSIHSQMEAFRWTESDGLLGLGGLTTQLRFETHAYDVSADGSVIVGSEELIGDIRDHRAFYWSNGIANLRDELIRFGATNLDGWHLAEAWGVSADGLTIVGRGRFEGQTQAWIATLPYPVPEPSTIVLAMLFIGGLIAFRTRRALCRAHM